MFCVYLQTAFAIVAFFSLYIRRFMDAHTISGTYTYTPREYGREWYADRVHLNNRIYEYCIYSIMRRQRH